LNGYKGVLGYNPSHAHHPIFAGSTVGSIAFQLSVAVWADVFHKYAWTVKYVWLLWGVIWLVWIVTHPSIVGGWLRAQPLPAGAGASSNVSGSPNVTAGSVAVGRDAYFGYPPVNNSYTIPSGYEGKAGSACAFIS